MNFLYRLYTIYAAVLFVLTFFIMLPFFVVSAQKMEWHHIGLKTNYIWARIYFPLIFMPVNIDMRYKPDRKKRYIMCANHFSYFDIPALARLPINFKFIGKSSIAKVPLFGYMFRKIHITVDRSRVRSRGVSLLKAKEALENGYNMAFFPEGGVKSQKIPKMVAFHDGAFRLAVETQLPIVPVSFMSNYKILPDDGKWMFHPYPLNVVIHEPIMPQGTGDEAISRLRKEVQEIIQGELNKIS